MLRPGSSTRPLSSHLNKIVVFKDGGSKADDLSNVVPSSVTGIKVAVASRKDVSASFDFKATDQAAKTANVTAREETDVHSTSMPESIVH